MDSFKNIANTESNSEGETPDLQKMMGLFNKLGNIDDPSKLTDIFESDLGIDINKFSSEISKILEK